MAEKNKTIRKTHVTYVGPDDLFTVDEQIEQCCKEVSVDICADVGKTEAYTAASGEEWEEKLEELRAKYPGANIIVKTVGPSGPCGKKYTEWSTNESCCDGVSPIVWDDENSVEVMSPDSYGGVVVTGGKSPYTWSIRGKGFAFSDDGTIRDAVTEGSTITVFALSDACGSANIYVTDGCSSAGGAIRSTDGQWVAQPSPGDNCPSISGEVVYDAQHGTWTVISGAYKFIQSSSLTYASLTEQDCDLCTPVQDQTISCIPGWEDDVGVCIKIADYCTLHGTCPGNWLWCYRHQKYLYKWDC